MTRMKVVLDIRSTLKEYSRRFHFLCDYTTEARVGEALVLESTLAGLGPPPSRTYDAIHHAAFKRDTQLGNRESILHGYSANIYAENVDLVVLRQPDFEDRLTAWVQKYLPILFMVCWLSFRTSGF